MTSVKRFFKLLCFLFIMFFMVGFGGEKVLAAADDSITVYTNPNDPNLVFKISSWPFYLKRKNNASGQYVFCLDSNRNVPAIGVSLPLTTASALGKSYSKSYNKVRAILKLAYELGLDDGNSSHSIDGLTISEKEMYGVTQIAVWKAIHGTGKGGINQKYMNWINGNSARSKLWEKLEDSSYSYIPGGIVVYAYPMGADGWTEVVENSVTYLVRTEYKIGKVSIPDSVKYQLVLTGTDAQISINGGEWTTTGSGGVQVSAGNTFKVRVVKPTGYASATVNANVSITSQSFKTGVDVAYYKSGKSSVQNVGLLYPLYGTRTTSVHFNGIVENPGYVKVQKVDKKTGEKVAGAKLTIYTSDNQEVITVTSTGPDKSNQVIELAAGDYYVKETEAPNNYELNDEKYEFTITNDLNVVDKNGNSISNATISVKDENNKIKIRKVDENGNPIAGVRIEIGNSMAHLAEIDHLLICGITDSNGYLTQACPGKEDMLYADGYNFYNKGTDIIYYVRETFPTGYYDSDFTDYDYDFSFTSNGTPIFKKSNVQFDEDTLTIVIYNGRYLKISKTDVTTGAEVPGATLTITDSDKVACFGIGEDYSADDCAADGFVESWQSGSTPHYFEGIELNHRYILTEDIAPEGYVKMSTSIQFEVDENGNVKTFDLAGNELTSLKGTNYNLLITNDYTKVSISKTDMVSGEEIEGAKIKLCTKDDYNSNGNDCSSSNAGWTWTSGQDGKDKNGKILPHQIDRLAVGEYCLIETIAPTGYAKKTSAVCFNVEENSGIQKVDFQNQPIRMVVSKKNQVTGERIAGATLQILNASDRSIAKDKDGNELTWISKADEDWIITGIPVGDYILVEIGTPEGYQEGMIIGDTGTEKGTDGEIIQEYAFSVTGKENIEFELDVPVLNAPNTGLSTLNLFAIGGLMIFAGYETIKIYRKRKVNS